jgi:dolichyl-phosphate beta-glucosyltransferase
VQTFLSIIIPCYNEANRLAACMERLHVDYLDHALHTYEIIIAVNGSSDGTLELAQLLSRTYQHVTVLNIPERGKGIAVRTGMLAARGTWRLMADSDWSMPPAEIAKLLPRPRDPEFDVCIASRELPGAHVTTSFKRRAIGRTFNAIVYALLGLPFSDTQCGFKLFSARSAECVFSQSHIDGWAFDVEILYLALIHGYSILEQGITWVNDTDSRVRLWDDSLQMFKDILSIRRDHTPPDSIPSPEEAPAKW